MRSIILCAAVAALLTLGATAHAGQSTGRGFHCFILFDDFPGDPDKVVQATVIHEDLDV